MDQEFFDLLFLCVAFIAGYGVRAMISLRHRREEQRIREAQERLARLKAETCRADVKQRGSYTD